MTRSINLPNQITLSRLGLACVFFALLSQYSHRTPQTWMLNLAGIIFIIAGLTDILDGYLARKQGLMTSLGRMLDPLVDKVLVCGAFILFLGPGFVDGHGDNVTEVRGWMVVVIVGRELLVTGVRGFSESAGRMFGASMYGKMKMWMQSIAVPAILLLVANEGTWAVDAWAVWTKKVLVWLTVMMTALSLVHYLRRAGYILDESITA